MVIYRPGGRVWITVVKADGSPHRRWLGCVEEAGNNRLTLVSRVGTTVWLAADSLLGRYYLRSHFWLGRRFNLSEFYYPDRRLAFIYSDICSPTIFRTDEVYYVDHELDVAFWSGETPQIVDEDEFAEAVTRYGYSAEFQRQCYAAAAEALVLVRLWKPAGVTAAFTGCPSG